MWRGPSKAKVVVRNEYTQAVGEGDLAICMHAWPSNNNLVQGYNLLCVFGCGGLCGEDACMHACVGEWVRPAHGAMGRGGVGLGGWVEWCSTYIYMCKKPTHIPTWGC